MRKGILMLILIACLGIAVSAHEIPDAGQLGSVEISTGISGGTWTIYRVGDVTEENGNYGFSLTGDFKNTGRAVQNVQSPELAAELARYAAENGLEGEIKDASDSVRFDNLEMGLYLFVQSQAAAGYERAEPFLVSIPMWDGEQYLYDVDASPKMSEIIPTETMQSQLSGILDPTLPQTGLLNWPVAALSVLGIGLTAVGWLLKRRM